MSDVPPFLVALVLDSHAACMGTRHPPGLRPGADAVVHACSCRHQALPPDAQAHLRSILEGVAANARYPGDGANDGDGPAGVPAGGAAGPAALAARDEQVGLRA